jgi:hypothetical protein
MSEANDNKVVYKSTLAEGGINQLSVDSSDNFYWNGKPIKKINPIKSILYGLLCICTIVIAYTAIDNHIMTKKIQELKLSNLKLEAEQNVRYDASLKKYEKQSAEYQEKLDALNQCHIK